MPWAELHTVQADLACNCCSLEQGAKVMLMLLVVEGIMQAMSVGLLSPLRSLCAKRCTQHDRPVHGPGFRAWCVHVALFHVRARLSSVSG